MPKQKTTIRYKAAELAAAVGHFGDGVQVFADVEIDGRVHTGECLAIEVLILRAVGERMQCAYCGAGFERAPYRFENADEAFCSLGCAQQWRTDQAKDEPIE